MDDYITDPLYSKYFIHYDIWIVIRGGSVLVKNVHTKKILKISDLTIQTTALHSIPDIIASSTGILTFPSEMKLIYESTSNEYKLAGLMLEINYDKDLIPIIESRFNGKFVSYKDMEDIVKRFEYSLEFQDSYCAFLMKMESLYGYRSTRKAGIVDILFD